jgi:hypothetical protein
LSEASFAKDRQRRTIFSYSTTANSLSEELAHLVSDETETAEYGRLNAFLLMHQDLNP